MENKECEACKMLTLYDDITVCPMCLWEQEFNNNVMSKDPHKDYDLLKVD